MSDQPMIRYFYCEKCKDGIVNATLQGRPYRFCRDCMMKFLEALLAKEYDEPKG